MSHTEAQAANKRRNANIVVGLGSGLLLLPLIFLVLALTGPAREQAEFLSLAGILAAVFSAPTLALWLALHAQAKRLEALPGPRPGGAPAPADGDLGPPSKKGG